MGRLDQKVALVTGGGNGIGKAIAQHFAREGARVVVNDLGADEQGDGVDTRPAAVTTQEILAKGGTAVADHGNVADTSAAELMVELALNTFGRLDIVANAAGILRDGMLTSMTDQAWDAIMEVHLRGHFAVTRAAARYWRGISKATNGPTGGRIFHFTSEVGLYGNIGQANYAAAKGGIAAFGITVASEVARYGVTSNVIAPRARTRLTKELMEGSLPTPEGYDVWAPDFIAPVVAYLASAAGAAYNGQIFVVGGGTLQTIRPYEVDHAMSFEAAPSYDEVEAFVKSACGGEAGPPPTANEMILQ